MGRPLKFKTPGQLEALANEYFAKRLDEDGYPFKDANGNVLKPITLSGLCLHLDTTRDVLDDYLDKPEYSNSVKRIKLTVECYYEGRLSYSSPTGPIFALKNFGWKDEQDHTLRGDPSKPLQTAISLDAESVAIMKRYVEKQESLKHGNT